ncbi:MAG: hypothetical protein KIT07_10120 [Anaerolineales bacterium]|nr:hypothetical protein [Anaerolineales bacterium]
MRGGGGGGGWRRYLNYDEEQAKAPIDRELLRRVWVYARPYFKRLALMLLAIVVTSSIDLLPPLLYRDLLTMCYPTRTITAC